MIIYNFEFHDLLVANFSYELEIIWSDPWCPCKPSQPIKSQKIIFEIITNRKQWDNVSFFSFTMIKTHEMFALKML